MGFVGVAVAVLLGYFIFLSFSAQQHISLEASLRSQKGIIPVEATLEICEKYECIEAWKTEIGDFMEFRSARHADFVAYVLGSDSRVNGRFVIDFSGKNISFQKKIDAIRVIFPGKDWY